MPGRYLAQRTGCRRMRVVSDSDESVLRTHAVTIAATLDTVPVTAVLTALPMSSDEQAAELPAGTAVGRPVTMTGCAQF
jgi:hypothetical protein